MHISFVMDGKAARQRLVGARVRVNMGAKSCGFARKRALAGGHRRRQIGWGQGYNGIFRELKPYAEGTA